LIRDGLGDSVYYIRYIGWFRMAMVHTKLIRMKWGMFLHTLQVAGIHQEQVRGPGVLQGDPKVLDTFVFVLYSKSLGAQKK
jgi:hypothetical protein